MYRAALALLEYYGYLRPAWNHGRLKAALVSNMVEGRAVLSHREVEELETAYALRIQADYEPQPVSASEAREIVDVASRFVTQIEGVIHRET